MGDAADNTSDCGLSAAFKPFHTDILNWAFERPEDVAVISGGAQTTYREFAERIDFWMGWLNGHGVRRGARVALSLGNTIDHLATVVALSMRGAAHISFSPGDGSTAVQRQADLCEVRYVITRSKNRLNGCELLVPPAPTAEDLRDHRDLANLEGADSKPGDIWKFVQSSGSTGTPKLLMQTQEMERSFLSTYPALDLDGEGEVRFLQTIALSFSFGLRLCLSVLMNGKTVVLSGRDGSMDALARAIERNRITHLVTTPFHAAGIAAAAAGGTGKPSCLRNVQVGGSIATDSIQRIIRRNLCDDLYVIYGTNEVGYISDATPAHLSRYPGSIGFPVPRVEVSIVDEKGIEVEAGQIGMLRARGPNYPTAYYRNPEADAASFRDGWFYPGDFAVKGADGELYFKGRADDLINFNGIKIAPIDIEECVNSHPAVRDAAAFVLSHPLHQDVPAVCVSLNRDITREKLSEFAAAKMGMRSPRFVMILDRIPMIGIGKPDRKAIHAAALKQIEKSG